MYEVQETLRRDQKLAIAHDLLFALVRLDPDIEFQPHYIDMRAAAPRRAGVLAIRVPERDVDAGELFVLQNISDHALHAEVCPDGKLAYAIRVLIRMGVRPKVRFELLVLACAAHDAIAGNLDRQRR